MNCPRCGCDLPSPVVVTGATVIDIREEWLEGEQEQTEPVLFVYVETERTAPPKEPLTEPKAEQPA